MKYGNSSHNQPSLSVVTPCYNEETGIDEFYRRVTEVCQKLASDDYEIVLVNDGSKDRTLDMLRELAEGDYHLVIVDLARNFGQQIALSAGLEASRSNRIFILDADLQDPPEILPEMMDRMDAGPTLYMASGDAARARAA